MTTSTIRLPKKLTDEIDHMIEKKYYFNRSDFVQSSIRYTLMFYADKRMELHRTAHDKNTSQNLLDQVYSSITTTYLKAYETYDGEPIQISIHVPDGISKRMSSLLYRRYGFTKKSDFIKVSVVCLLMKIKETDEIYDGLDEYLESQKIVVNEVYKMMFEGLKDGKNGQEIIESTVNYLLENKNLF